MGLVALYRDVFQISYVARDLDKAIAFLREATGAEDFVQRDDELVVRVGGRDVPQRIRVAIVNSGDKQIEVIQPVSGAIDHYIDGIDFDRSVLTFHHIGVAVRAPIANWTQMEADVRAQGDDFVVSFAADAGHTPVVRFAYVDTRPKFGHFTEYLWWDPVIMAGNPAFPVLRL